MKPSGSIHRFLLLFLATFTLAFTPAFVSKPVGTKDPESRTDGNRIRALEITAITQWHYETVTDKGRLFRTAVFKDVHVAWDPYIELRGYFDSKAMGVGTVFITREVQEVKLPAIGNWPVIWVADGTVSPEGAIDMRLALYDLQGIEHAEVLYGGMVLSAGTEAKPPESYKTMFVHLEAYETYKAVPLGMGGTLELFVLRGKLPPVSALVPDVDPTELEWSLGSGEVGEFIGNIITGKFDVIKDIIDLHVEEWTGGWGLPW